MTNPSPRAAWLALLLALPSTAAAGGAVLDRDARHWGPFVEWTISNPTFEGNPYDLEAHVTFTHTETGETRRTGMFYAGDREWKFRFTGTRTGAWTFLTASPDPELSGRRGTVSVRPNPDPRARGFVAGRGNRWVWTGTDEAFVPQIVMYRSPDGYFRQPERIDADLRTWFVEHGFNGLHTDVLCRWFDLDKTSADEFDTDDPNPDPRTFEALELLITRAHAAGGFVHIWAWGDESRRMTPVRWGINGHVDRRLQRYLAARLGPLQGWTMGYGFDLWEWVDEDELAAWHGHLHEQSGWPHLIGGRVHRHGTPLGDLITDKLDYIGYETHQPDARTYARALELHPLKPVMMEDRFRVRQNSRYPEKDYDLERTRRGLWHSTMAGGVGNIWGYLVPEAGDHGMSQPYPNREQIRTYATFFESRFLNDLSPAPDLSDGLCLRDPAQPRYLFYQEDTAEVRLDLSGVADAQSAVAVDTKQPYRELKLNKLPAREQVWTAPYRSDWAVAVGVFPGLAKEVAR